MSDTTKPADTHPFTSGSVGTPHARSWFGTAYDENDQFVGLTLSNSYEVLRMLGEGAMGRVYEARHTRIRTKRFAIKVLHPEFMRHPQVLARFEREAEATGALEHRNVVGVYDVDRAPDGRPFIVCEYLEGAELGEHLDQVGQLPIPRAVSIAQQLCDALGTAHRLGVVHRDMKPENVFLVGNPNDPIAKVLDFGLSRLDQAAGDTLTQAGTVMGTPSYMAPEQARGDRVDSRADVYGVGAILYRSLTGRRPFERDDAAATLAAVLTEDPARPRSVEPNIPEELELVIQRAMAKHPEERFQTMEELSAGLYAFTEEAAQAAQLAAARRAAQNNFARASLTLAELPRSVRHVRTRLFGLSVLSLLWAMAVLTTAAGAAVGLATGRSASSGLTPSETALLVAAVAGALTTPLVLAVRHVAKRVWHDSVRVTKLLDNMRAVLTSSMVAYGITAVAIRIVDSVVTRFVTIDGPTGLAWPAWALVLGAISAIAAATASMRRSLATGPGQRAATGMRAFIAGPALSSITILLGVGIFYGAILWRPPLFTGEASPEGSGMAADPSSSVAVPPGSSKSVSPTTPSGAPVEDTGPRATADELAHAVASGAPALEALAQRYPEDPAVMRALVETYAGDEKNYLKALEWSGKLVDKSPEANEWRTLRTLILRTAQGDEPAASRAFELMATRMGSHGPDLLYDLMIGAQQNVRDRAQVLLSQAAVHGRATPALRIAYDLRIAETCDKQVELLDRAAADGDDRTISVLSYVTDGSKTGCGFRRKQRCPPRCGGEKHAGPMRAAIDKIRARMRSQ
jgi:serine/threonine-protein kinase